MPPAPGPLPPPPAPRPTTSVDCVYHSSPGAQDDLFRCKTILQQYFDTTFPEAAAAAEMHRASICPARSESPGSVMDKMCI